MTTFEGWGSKGWIALVVGLTLGGCATTAGPALVQDIRGDAAVTGHEARPLVAGPIRLLHVNFDSRAAPQFSRVWRRNEGVDCRRATPLAWDGQSAVEIEKDEMICVAAPTPTRVSWHGRSVDAPAPPVAHPQASLP